jgi:hydroxyethylthiazole kinase-like uncharacterized protein yjeF
VIPIVTPSAMRAIDAAAPEPVEVLIERAGAEVARAAIDMLGSTYGRRVAVLAGGGNNGADGRVAGDRLRRRGVAVTVFDAARLPASVAGFDLVIDAAYGTGFRGTWRAPHVGATPVLAVDIVSGLDAMTGDAGDGVVAAERTVTFAAAKPGHVLGRGLSLSGQLVVADIGLDIGAAESGPSCAIVEAVDIAAWLPRRSADAHKWQAAVRVVAGSAGMTGAAWLASAAAQRAGAGMVVASTPGAEATMPIEVVQRSVAEHGWSPAVLDGLARFGALVIGPGLGLGAGNTEGVRDVVDAAPIPTLVDGDGLTALAGRDGWQQRLAARPAPTVLTPHAGEFARLTVRRPGDDPITSVRRLAAATRSVVLLKGPATIVSDPEGRTLVVTAGDQRLATAGTGDVLAGIIGAVLARGAAALEAAAVGAWLHGRAGRRGPSQGLIAGDLIGLIPHALAEVAP